MSSAFMELLAFILVAGLIFFNDSDSKSANTAKLILAIGSCVWLVAQAVIAFIDRFAG